jgi:hypothetical protein
VAVGVAVCVLSGCGAGVAAVGPGQKTGTKGRRPTHVVCAQRTAFELSLVSDRGGQPTPLAAATWFADHGGVGGIPRSGWRVTGQNHDGATVTSGRTSVHAIRGSDGTWQVDSGTTCR